MRSLIYISFMLLPALCAADTFVLKDGTRLEAEETGEMENTLLVRTKYGSLTISKADVQERIPSAPASAPAAAPAPAAEVSTAQPVAVSTTQPAAPEPAPRFTFETVLPSTSTRLLVYYENGVAIATETFDAAGLPVSTEGAVKDGTYTEYYPDGRLKTVKSVLGGRTSGTLKAYYPSGTLQLEAYYLGGLKDGAFRYFSEDGKPLLEASYRGDRLNGWKKEFDDAGAVKSQIYYEDDRPSEPPKPKVAAEPAKEQESPVTGKIILLARGEQVLFKLNGRYLGKIQLDRRFNIISQEGKIPDGSIKIYSEEGNFSRNYGSRASGVETFNWAGKLAREFIFEGNRLKLLKTFDITGKVATEYTYKEDIAIKQK